ncbi:MAG: hypothetical protein MJ056_06425 [Akkermansia sp.]|nr:hypothetical protein [Akkermansia sp.]
MKLRLPHQFQAALIAALASVSFTTLSSGSAYAEDAASTDVGKILFMGDSITHGVHDQTYRWQLFKSFVDNGITFDINGPRSGYNSDIWNMNDAGDAYGGVSFENAHYAEASGRAYQMISGQGHYTGQPVSQIGKTDYDTYTLLIGTNDILSDTKDPVSYATYADKFDNLLGGTVSYSGADKSLDAKWTWTKGATMSGDLNTILNNMNLGAGDNFYVLSIPVWASGHGNHNTASDHAAVAGYNTMLEQWVAEYNKTSQANVQFVDVNKGLTDVTILSTQSAEGPYDFFRNADRLHPSQQGSIIMAGNLNRAMGLAGRTAGLSRSATTEAGWTAAPEQAVTLNNGEYATLLNNTFIEDQGYTIDFKATFGNGEQGGWLDAGLHRGSLAGAAQNTLAITIGDGVNGGTLNLSEGYVMWGDSILYCQDNSRADNETIRIAFHNGNTAQNVAGGYYVWLGDMLIGQGLGATGGSGLNGVSVVATGGSATLTGLMYADTAYAPTTTYAIGENPYHVVQDPGYKELVPSSAPMPTHDNTPSTSGVDYSDAGDLGNQKGITNSSQFTGDATFIHTSRASWIAAAAVNFTHSINAKIDGGSVANTIFGVQAGTTTGNVTLDIANLTLGSGAYGQTSNVSIGAAFTGASIQGTFAVYLDKTTVGGDIFGGAVNSSGDVGRAEIYLNSGSVGGSIYGGGYGGAYTGGSVGSVSITINGGTVQGSVHGDALKGAVAGDSNILIKGGVIRGDVLGGTVGGATNVTIDGNLASIGGNITADTVTLKNVEASGYTGGFDTYNGTITADAITLENYTAGRILASLVTESLVLKGGTDVTIHNLNLTACDITTQDTSTATLDGTLTLGNTATYNGSVALADGLVISMDGSSEFHPSGEYSEGTSGFKLGSREVMKLADGAAAGSALTVNTGSLVGAGALAGNTFSYDTDSGMLTATGADTTTFYVNAGDTVQYSSPAEKYPAYAASTIAMNGGTLEFLEALKEGANLTVQAGDSTVVVSDGASTDISRFNLGGFALNLDGTLTASSAAEVTANLVGENANITTTGNITLANGDATHAGGVLTIGDGLNFSMNGAKGYTYDISSFKQVVLGAGSAINYQAKSATFHNVTLANGDASISITDMGATDDMLTLADETQLNGHKLAISAPNTSWKRYVTIEKLVGDDAGTLYFEGGKTDDGSGSHLTINSLQGFSGTLELKENRTGNPLTAVVKTGSGSAVNMKALSLTGTGEALTVQGNADLSIGTLTVSGSSALKVEMYGTPSHQLTIGKILGSGTTASTTVELYTNSGNNITANHFILGADGETYGDNLFTGTVWVTSKTSQGASSRATTDVYLAAQDVLRDATLKLSNWASNYNNTRISLSLGTDARVAGIAAKDNGNNSGLVNRGSYIRSGSLSVAQPDGIANFVSTSDQAYTLEITGSGTYEADSRILDKVNLHMNGSGTQTFTGTLSNMSYFDGSITVSKGKLVLTPNSTLSTHAVEVAAGAELTINPTGVITASATMHNGGTMNLTGTVKLDTVHMADFDVVEGSAAPVYSGVDRGTDHYANSGFLETSARYYLVKGSEGSTLTGTVDIDPATGTKVEQTDDKSIVVTFKSNPEGGMFYVNDSFTYGSDMDAASDISIARDATLTSAGMAGSNTAKALHGDGTYVITGGSNNFTSANGYGLGKSFSLSSDWTGTVVVSGTSTGNLVDFARLANGKLSTVEVKGLDGWTSDWNGAIEENIKLTDVGNTLAWSNGATTGSTTNNTATFSGKWSGTGTFERKGSSNMHYTYKGDISEWTGKFKMSGGTTTLTFAGSANVVNATIERGGGTLNLVADTDVQFNKDLTVTGFTNASHTVTLGDGITLTMHALSAGQEQNLGNIVVEKSATIVDTNFNATMNFTSITGGKGGTLTLLSSHSASTSEWNLGVDGQTQATPFGGKLVLMSERDGSNNRAANFNFVDGTMFSGAEVQIKNGTDVTNYILTNTLKLKAANVTIGGLSDAAADMVTDKRKWSVANGTDQGSATLTLNGSDTYTSDIKLEGGVNLAMNGTGKQTFSGDMSAFNGSLTVNNGTLAITGNNGISAAYIASDTSDGTLDVTGVLTVTGAEAGMADFTGSLKVGGLHVDGGFNKINGIDRLGESIQVNNGGYLLLGIGTYELSGLTLTGPGEVTPTEGNGYTSFSGTVQFITLNDGDYAGSDGLTFKYGKYTTHTLDQYSGVVTFDEHDYTTYYVNGDATYSDAEMGKAQYLQIKEGQVLTAGGTPSTAKTLVGSGTYALASNAKTLGDKVSLDADNWTGTVAISNVAFANDMKGTLEGLVNENSWVALKGTSGWAASCTINANLLLEKGNNDWAFAQNDGNNGNTLTFAGKIAGDGKLGRSSETGSTYTYEFTNDISKWNGTFESRSFGDRYTMFRVKDAATEVNASLTKATGVFKVDVQNQATFNGDVSGVDALTVAANQSATFTNVLEVSGTINLGTGATLTLSGDTAIAQAIAGTATSTVVFNHDITASGLADGQRDYFTGLDGQKATDENYFIGKEAYLTVVTGGGTVNTGGYKVTQGGKDYLLDADGTAAGEKDIDYTSFCQFQAGTTLNASTIDQTAQAHGQTLGTVSTAAAKLILDRSIDNVYLFDGAELDITNDSLIRKELSAAGDASISGYLTLTQNATFSLAKWEPSSVTFTDSPFEVSGVTFTASAGTARAVVSYTGTGDGEADMNNYEVYGIANANFKVAADVVQKNIAGGDVTVGNKIEASEVRNDAPGTYGALILTSGADATVLDKVIATRGNIEFYNMSDTDQANLNTLNIGEGMAVSVYTGNVAEAAQEASVTVVGTLTAGEGAHLNANLEMADGSTLDVSAFNGNGGLFMGSSVTLNPGNITLSDDDIAHVQGLGFMEAYDLFRDVEEFNIGSTGYESIGLTDQWVKASEVFNNELFKTGEKEYYVFYSGTAEGGRGENVGTIYLLQAPEPTTGTLSLLALCALAARRRRKG